MTKTMQTASCRLEPRAGARANERGVPWCTGLGALLGAALLAPAEAPRAQQADRSDPAIEEVVVTARKRSEDLQQTPLAISALGSERLTERGVRDLAEASRFVPNLSFRKAGGFAGGSSTSVIFIRGAGQSDFILPSDPGVGVYLDGVYHARMVGAALDLADAERVEVLRGPQGTLFGRNAIGGAINVIAKKPDPGGFDSYAEVTAGQNDHYAFKGALNVPLSEQLALRVSGQRRARGGYVELLEYGGKTGGEENLISARPQLRYQSEGFDTLLAFDYTRERERGGPWVAEQIRVLGDDPDANFIFGSSANTRPGAPADCITALGQRTNPACFGPVHEVGKFKSRNAFFEAAGGRQIDPRNEVKNYGVSWTSEFEVGSSTLKLISSYRKLDATFTRSLSQTPLVVFSSNTPRFDSDQYSQEIQLGGSAGKRLDWVGGLYGFRERGVQTQDQATSLFLRTDTRIEVKNVSLAAFLTGTVHFTDALHLTLGGRLTGDDKEGHVDVPNFFDADAGMLDPTFLKSSRRTRKFTPSANLSWNATPQIMTYASFAQGYKNGSFAARLPFPNEVARLTTSKPEYLTMFEVGVKSDLFEDRVRANLAAFYGNYEDIQVTYGPETTPPTPPLVGNVNAARVYGVELELQALLSANLSVSGALGLLHSEYTDVDTERGVPPTPFWSRHTRLQRSPSYQASLGLNYSVPLRRGTLVFGADWSIVGKEALDVEPAGYPYAIEGAWNSGNASIGYLAPGDRWGITLHVQNVTDEAHKVSILDGSRDGWGVAETVYNRPREAFVTVNYRF